MQAIYKETEVPATQGPQADTLRTCSAHIQTSKQSKWKCWVNVASLAQDMGKKQGKENTMKLCN